MLTVSILLIFSVSVAFGQGLLSEGREFYIGHIRATHSSVVPGLSLSQQRVYAIVSSYTDNEIFVSYFHPQSGTETAPQKHTLMAYHAKEILLDDLHMQSDTMGDVKEFRACHIVSKHPIAVQYYRSGSCATGGYLALPVGTWGKEYVVASDPDNPGYGAYSNPPVISGIDMANGCFLIIASTDGTNVSISPNALTGGGHTGATQGLGATGNPQPYTITLNRGQTYFVRSVGALYGAADDISGSIIKADKPIAVITAHENANVGDGIVNEESQTDARDFLIEQAIPWEYAHHKGITTIPMVDAKGGLDGGYGEDIKVFVTDNDPATAVTIQDCNGSVVEQSTSPYSVPPVTRANVLTPLQFVCDSGKRMQVVQYELRSDGEGAPHPAPAMMNIVPTACWRNAYLWHIPKKPDAPAGLPAYEEYYVTVIGNASIEMAINGGTIKPINQSLKSVVKKWSCVPGISGVSGTTYRLSPATTYYARSLTPFMVYVFGFAATHEAPIMIDPIVSYSGFAFPVGLRGRSVGVTDIGVEVDTLCASWRVCATDKAGAGIKSVALLNDPDRNYIDLSVGSTNETYVATNCRFVSATSHDSMEVLKVLPEQRLCVIIQVIDSTQDAYVPIAVTDAQGNFRIIELRYTGKQLSRDSKFVGFNNVRIGDTAYASIKIRSQNSFLVNSIELTASSVLKVRRINRSLPFVLFKDDSLIVDIEFTPSDTIPVTGTITFSSDCLAYTQMFMAKGGTGLIVAEDKDFGTIVQQSTRCQDVRVENRGNVPFHLTAILSTDSKFTVKQSDLDLLPIRVNPGSSVFVGICFQPLGESSDSATISWETDIPPPYTNSIKSSSMVFGRGVLQNVRGEPPTNPTIHPNPAYRGCSIDLRSFKEEYVRITVFNVFGTECLRIYSQGTSEVDLDLSDLPSGAYIVQLVAKEKSHYVQLILE